jgi:hypothetical protein
LSFAFYLDANSPTSTSLACGGDSIRDDFAAVTKAALGRGGRRTPL